MVLIFLRVRSIIVAAQSLIIEISVQSGEEIGILLLFAQTASLPREYGRRNIDVKFETCPFYLAVEWRFNIFQTAL